MALGGKPQREDIYVKGVEPPLILDPGNAGTIDVSRSGVCELSSVGGAQTRSLPDPKFRGQTLDLVFVLDGGDIVVTAVSPVNQTGNNTITFQDVGALIQLTGAYNATDGWEWKTIVTDGAALSTVP